MAQAIRHVPQELWGTGIIQGVAAILFGIAAVFWPGLSLVTLVYLFSAFVLAWGIISMISGVLSIKEGGTWWLPLLFGVASLGVGLYLVRNPDVAFSTFVILAGFTLIVRGLVDILGTLLNETGATAQMLWRLLGAAAVVVGIVILNQSADNGVGFVWLLGLYALVYGTLVVAMALDEHANLHDVTVSPPRR